MWGSQDEMKPVQLVSRVKYPSKTNPTIQQDILPHTYSHVHHIIIMLSQFFNVLLSLQRFISGPNFSASVGNWFSVIYSISLSSDVGPLSYKYSTDDKLYLLLLSKKISLRIWLVRLKFLLHYPFSSGLCLPSPRKQADGGIAAWFPYSSHCPSPWPGIISSLQA